MFRTRTDFYNTLSLSLTILQGYVRSFLSTNPNLVRWKSYDQRVSEITQIPKKKKEEKASTVFVSVVV